MIVRLEKSAGPFPLAGRRVSFELHGPASATLAKVERDKRMIL
jgi:hypothetical protein